MLRMTSDARPRCGGATATGAGMTPYGAAETGHAGGADGTGDIPTTAVEPAGSVVTAAGAAGSVVIAAGAAGSVVIATGAAGTAGGCSNEGAADGCWGTSGTGAVVMAASGEGVVAGWVSPSVGGFDTLGLL
jgi:hypothetical protein